MKRPGETLEVRAAAAPHVEASSSRHSAQHIFCAGLRAQRERSGISLRAIAQSTKISASLFADLERNDLSRWPAGLYRRAFFRDYAAAIGLPVEPTTREFIRLFCENDSPPAGDPAVARSDEPAPLRITYAAARVWRPAWSRHRARAAAMDAAGVLVAGALLAWWTALTVWAAAGVVALCYYPLTAALLGPRMSLWSLVQRRPATPARREATGRRPSRVSKLRRPLLFVRTP